MAYIDDGDSGIAQLPDELKQAFHVCTLQAAGGLVHEDERSTLRQSAADFHDLTRGDREFGDGPLGRDVGMLKGFKNIGRLPVQRLPIKPAQALRLNSEENIFSNREMRTEQKFLMNVGDAVAARVQRIGGAKPCSPKRYGPPLLTGRGRADVDQRAPSSALFSP